MPIPNAERAEVSRDKIVDYLLNPQHPDGAGKAAFYLAAGFGVERWEELADALKGLAVRVFDGTSHRFPARIEVYCRWGH